MSPDACVGEAPQDHCGFRIRVYWMISALAVAVALSAVAAPTSLASGSYFGERYLWQGQCCGGADIEGDRATITTPNSNFTTTPNLCALQRVAMEGATAPPA